MNIEQYQAVNFNRPSCLRWQSRIYFLIHSSVGYHIKDIENEEMSQSPRVLVFVNPNSGTGTAVKAFNSRVRSFLGEANISYDLVVTTHTGHCKTVVKACSDLSRYAGIVTVSGDGLPFEVIAAILKYFVLVDFLFERSIMGSSRGKTGKRRVRYR